MHALKRHTYKLFCSLGLLASALLAGCGGGDNGRAPILGLPGASLVSVAVSPAAPQLKPGLTQQFHATATYADATTLDVTGSAAWTSSTPAVATINASTGLATTVSDGDTAISASFGGQSGAARLSVASPTVTALMVAPQAPSLALGTTRQLTAVASYSDGTSGDVTSSTAFSSAAMAVASITPGGLVSARTSGAALMTGTFGGQSGTTTVTVMPATVTALALTPQAPALTVGATRQLVALATFSDGSSGDVTGMTTFSSADANIASASSAGLVSGVAAGTAVITGSVGGMSATTTATVSDVALTGIAVTPASATVAIGGNEQFVATATYADGSVAVITTSALWTSSQPATAAIDAHGLATGAAAGSAGMTASYGGKSGTGTLTVLATAPVVTLDPVNLRSAANFGVLAGTSITNNAGGTTLISGDVGSPSQTVDPTQAAGFNNYKSGAILSGALADLQVAITEANGRACTVSFAGGIDLGGLVLIPGVYCATGAISLTGTLNLSGNGVYVFRTASTLDTTANAIVALTNGASDANVFWLPVGPTTLGANSVFKGSILGQAAAITLGDGANVQNGRVLTAAAATLANNVITK